MMLLRSAFFLAVLLAVFAVGAAHTDPDGDRILYIATTLDAGDWVGFNQAKFDQLRAVRGLEFRMIAFGRNGTAAQGSYVSAVDPTTGNHELQKVSDIGAFDTKLFASFVKQHVVPNRTHLVVGTHGMGGFLWFNNVTYDGGRSVTDDKGYGVSFPSASFAKLLGDNMFRTIVFDSCLMAEVFTASALARSTPLMLTNEGYMWSADKAVNQSFFSTYAAEALAFKSSIVGDFTALKDIARYYTSQQLWGDASVLRTSAADAVADIVQHNKMYMNNVSVWMKWAQYNVHQSRNATDLHFSPYAFYTKTDDRSAQTLLDLRALFTAAGDAPGEEALARMLQYRIQPAAPVWTMGYNFALGGVSLNMRRFYSLYNLGNDTSTFGH